MNFILLTKEHNNSVITYRYRHETWGTEIIVKKTIDEPEPTEFEIFAVFKSQGIPRQARKKADEEFDFEANIKKHQADQKRLKEMREKYNEQTKRTFKIKPGDKK